MIQANVAYHIQNRANIVLRLHHDHCFVIARITPGLITGCISRIDISLPVQNFDERGDNTLNLIQLGEVGVEAESEQMSQKHKNRQCQSIRIDFLQIL